MDDPTSQLHRHLFDFIGVRLKIEGPGDSAAGVAEEAA